MSRGGRFWLTNTLGPIASVLVALGVSVSSDRLYLPVIGGLGDEPLSLLFLGLPVASSAAIGLRLQRSVRVLLAGGIVVLILTQLASYVVWIG